MKKFLSKWGFFLIYTLIGIYGIFFNQSWFDESKYIFKGYLMLTGKISWYNTPGFLYQHMPGSMLWMGLSQIPFGPSLLAARIQSLIIGMVVFWMVSTLAYQLGGKRTRLISQALMISLWSLIFHYAAALPYSLVALLLLTGSFYLYQGFKNNKLLLIATASFTLAALIRENFLPTLFIYWIFLGLWLVWKQKKWRFYVIQLFLSAGLISIVIALTQPGIFKVLANLPLIKTVAINQVDKIVLELHWYNYRFTPFLQLQALNELLRSYQPLFILIAIVIIYLLSQPHKIKTYWQKLYKNSQAKALVLLWLMVAFIFNVILHTWSASLLSPRAINVYMAYFAPLGIVAVSYWLTILIQKKSWLWSKTGAIIFITLLIFSINPDRISILGWPWQRKSLPTINQSAITISQITRPDERIFFLGQPIVLHLANRVTYGALFNSLNFFKPGAETAVVKKYGFWNEALADQWLNDAQVVLIEENILKTILNSVPLSDLAKIITDKLEQNYKLVDRVENFWPSPLLVFKPIN